MNPQPRVCIVIVNTNELHHLRKCLPAIYAQDYSNFEVLIVDNVSTDGSLEWVAANFPAARIVRNKSNLGYAGANNVGFDNATGDYVAVLNPDTQVEPAWLKELVGALEADPAAGLATPKIVHMNRPEFLNSCGNEISITGLTFCRGLDQPVSAFSKPEKLSAISGAAFVIRRDVLARIGGFDESFFIYYEDTDLSIRALIAGYDLLYVPTAVVKHLYIFKFSPRKCLFQERNRYSSLLKNLRWPTLLILTPALMLSELIVWGYLCLRGPAHMWAKLKSYFAVLGSAGRILSERKKIQTLRRARDRDITARFGRTLTLAQTASPWIANLASAIFNPLLYLSWAVSRALIWW